MHSVERGRGNNQENFYFFNCPIGLFLLEYHDHLSTMITLIKLHLCPSAISHITQHTFPPPGAAGGGGACGGPLTLRHITIQHHILLPAGPAPRHLSRTYLIVRTQLSVRIVYRAVFSFHLFFFLFCRKLETTAFHHQLDLRHFAIKV